MPQVLEATTTTVPTREYIQQNCNTFLSTLLSKQVQSGARIGVDYADLLSTIQQLIERGGKRLRPLLVSWSYGGFGGNNASGIVQVAASQELFHAALLIHDDIIDRDTVRWNGPNITGHYVARFRSSYGSVRSRQLADSWALLAGDVCTGMAFEQLLNSDFDATRKIAALNLLHGSYFAVLGGEVMDVSASLVDQRSFSLDELLAICRYKTASYSFSLPLELGAILAGAPSQQQILVSELGIQLGVAYQLQDDLLGMFGDERTTGKSGFSDLREGKQTVLMQYALRHASSSNQAILRACLGNAHAKASELRAVRSILEQCGARSYVDSLITSYYDNAQVLLEQIAWQPDYTAELTNLFSALIGRRS